MADLSTTKVFGASDNVAYTDLNAIITGASINESAISGRLAAATISDQDSFLISSGPGTLKRARADAIKNYLGGVYPACSSLGGEGPFGLTNVLSVLGTGIVRSTTVGRVTLLVYNFTTYTVAGGATLLQYQVFRTTDSSSIASDLVLGISIGSPATIQTLLAFDGATLAGNNGYVLKARTDVGTVQIRNLNTFSISL